MSVRFELAGAGLRYGEVRVLGGVTLGCSSGELVAIAGPNGAGKSTLVGILAGLKDRYDGSCLLDGRAVRAWPRKELARRVSFVPQAVRTDFPFSAEQVVLMGRLPHASGLFERDEDFAAAEQAMALTGALEFRARYFRSLSGGERQRVILAAALAQCADALIRDEPTTYLDLEHQLSLYRLLRERARQGQLVITVTHDLNLAATYCDRVIALRRGEVVADGVPADVLTPARLADVFHVQADVQTGPGGRPWIVYGG
ncbi:MAG: ABC transporter ATP-binding protein [Bryobacterales bacterium]|nr:ABC transporter ATP-binding protein [Bryobacterales bacterium]